MQHQKQQKTQYMYNRYCIIRDDGITKDVIFQDLSFQAGQRTLLELFNAAYKTKYKNWIEITNIPIVTSFDCDFASYMLKEILPPND